MRPWNKNILNDETLSLLILWNVKQSNDYTFSLLTLLKKTLSLISLFHQWHYGEKNVLIIETNKLKTSYLMWLS